MKKKNIFIALSVLALSAPLAFSLSKVNVYQEAKAYKINSLPTTIYLKDNEESEIRNYYSQASGLKGDNLLIKLKTILSNNQKYYSYDSNTAIWQMYEIIDRDWAKSPASAVAGYDVSTNTITGYTYGTNASHPNDPYVRALYVNRDVDNETTAWSTHQQTDKWGINQEHIWPKSHGFDVKGSDSSGGARGDPMHLWAGNGYANNIHSNDYYGYVDKTKTYVDCGNKFSNVSGNYSGTSKTVGSGTVFEPQDSDKGDIARAVFYMVARYNNLAGDDSKIDGNNPNLTLDNNINLTTGTSTATEPFSLGVLSDLLEWNELDPVDDYEIHRNNLLFNNYTNNRNPFIDFPEWANIIWGGEDKTADPANDSLNGSPIKVDKGSISIAPNGTSTITATVDSPSITWEVGDPSIISLDKTTTTSGETVTITALKEGTTTITIKAVVDGDPYERVIKVTVANPSENKGFVLDTKTIIIIAAIVVVVIVILVIVFATSKKARKKAGKAIKKQAKKQVKKSTKKK